MRPVKAVTAGILAVLCVMVTMEKPVEATDRCRIVLGRLTLVPSTEPGCTSPVGVCGTGDFFGVLRGSYVSQLTSLVPTADTPVTGDVLITGDTTMDARLGSATGQLRFKDAGAFKTVGEGNFAELFTITGGTNGFTGTTGVLHVTGTYDFATGGEGEYHGRVCFP